MELLVVRHAIAEEREDFARTGRDDAERPLTSEGRKKMRRGAAGLRELVRSIDVLASSPLTRAWQTAEILSAAFGAILVTRVDALSGDLPPDELLPWLREQRESARVAVVGHEPHLSSLVTWLLTGDSGHVIELKKGAACLLELHGAPREGVATLLWALTPGQLRRLAPKP
jgi:phosphohistidine phosphatase